MQPTSFRSMHPEAHSSRRRSARDWLLVRAPLLALIGSLMAPSPLWSAVLPGGTRNDERISIGYDANSGEVFLDAAGQELDQILILSERGVFSGEPSPYELCDAIFCNDTDYRIEHLGFGIGFGDYVFGKVAQTGLDESLLLSDLTATGRYIPSGAFGPENIDLIYIPVVPEPSTGVALWMGAGLWLVCRRSQAAPWGPRASHHSMEA